MFSKLTYLKNFSLFTIITLTSCAEDTGFIEISSDMEDQKLKANLVALAGDLNYYILPESDNFAAIPADPNNPLNKDKVLLGKLLYHETGIGVKAKKESHQKTYSCASCHHSAAGFQSGMKQGIGDGGMGFGLQGETRVMAPGYTADMLDVQPIKSPTVLNVAYQKLMLWNGQFGATDQNIGTEANWTAGTPKEVNNLGFEGIETQAIAGLTVHRMDITKTFCTDYNYDVLFDKAFPEIDESERYTLITAGLAIAAYERTLLANDTNFQGWLKGDAAAMTSTEKQGALLFFGKGRCYECHSGPALNSEAFCALGMNDLSGNDVHGTVDEGTKKGRGGFYQ
jgi:cytochrome c peroxidase